MIVGHSDNFDQLYWMQCDRTLCELVRLIIVSFINTHITENLTDKSNLDQLNNKIRPTRALNDYWLVKKILNELNIENWMTHDIYSFMHIYYSTGPITTHSNGYVNVEVVHIFCLASMDVNR